MKDFSLKKKKEKEKTAESSRKHAADLLGDAGVVGDLFLPLDELVVGVDLVGRRLVQLRKVIRVLLEVLLRRTSVRPIQRQRPRERERGSREETRIEK
jgi:hypothetical protein